MVYSRFYSKVSARATAGGRACAERWRLLGYCPRGRLWSKAEVEAVRKYHPDYKRIRQLLSDRTLDAIKLKAREIGVAKSRGHQWSVGDVRLLRKFYPNYAMAVVKSELPFVSEKAIRRKANKLGIVRTRSAFKLSGQKLYDALRLKCREIGYTRTDMGELIGRPHYFSTLRPRDMRLVCEAIRALDGEVSISGRVTWQ